MTMRQFIKENRTELDQAIHKAVPSLSLNDSERQQWVLNDEGLYHWARSCGVRI